MDSHRDRILDQFSRQAVPFATAPSIRNEDALNRIVQIAEAGRDDTVLDVACGPGLLVCAFGRIVKHATGIDLTPAMLEQAAREQQQQGLKNISWQLGDVNHLPYEDATFSIVASRFALHHLLDPLTVLREMRRVCKPGGRVVVADSAPVIGKAQAFNEMEVLRDPSHVRAMPLEELLALFEAANLPEPRLDRYRVQGELEGLLQRSFPNPGDDHRIRELFEQSLADDALDMAVVRKDGRILFGYPVAILASRVPA